MGIAGLEGEGPRSVCVREGNPWASPCLGSWAELAEEVEWAKVAIWQLNSNPPVRKPLAMLLLTALDLQNLEEAWRVATGQFANLAIGRCFSECMNQKTNETNRTNQRCLKYYYGLFMISSDAQSPCRVPSS